MGRKRSRLETKKSNNFDRNQKETAKTTVKPRENWNLMKFTWRSGLWPPSFSFIMTLCYSVIKISWFFFWPFKLTDNFGIYFSKTLLFLSLEIGVNYLQSSERPTIFHWWMRSDSPFNTGLEQNRTSDIRLLSFDWIVLYTTDQPW